MQTVNPDLIQQLQQHAIINNLDQVALDAIQRWLKEDTDLKVSVAEIEPRFASRWLCFEPEIVGYPYLDTRFNLFYHGRQIGYYRLITHLDGSVADDYFVLEDGYSNDAN